MNVLIVDDSKSFVSQICESLNDFFKAQINIFTAYEGYEAIKSAQTLDIDIILLDIMMSGIDGIEVAKTLQHTQKTKDIPIIFVTSSSYEDFRKFGFELGSVDYISKPVDMNILINRMNLYKTILEQNKILQHNNKLLESEINKEKVKSKIQEDMLIHHSKISVMGEMIGAIAHQWRQPLNIIATSIMNLETKAELDLLDLNEIKRINSKINTTLGFLSKTIDDFRNFFLTSKKKETIDFKEAVLSTIDIVKTQFSSHGIQISFYYEEEKKYPYYGYYNELRQVFLNLLANSKDSIELLQQEKDDFEGKIKVRIKDSPKFIEIYFCDNGKGIDESIKEKVFNPYFTTKFSAQGTGIGLYIVKTIVEKVHEGKIKIIDKNEGACFKLLFFK